MVTNHHKQSEENSLFEGETKPESEHEGEDEGEHEDEHEGEHEGEEEPAASQASGSGLTASIWKWPGKEWPGWTDEEDYGPPTKTKTDPQVNYKATEDAWPGFGDIKDKYTVKWEGFLTIKKGGKYRFYLTSDDGSMLWINDEVVVDNGGWHWMKRRTGRVALKPGKHKVRLEMFEDGGGQGCIWEWKARGIRKSVVPAKVLSTA